MGMQLRVVLAAGAVREPGRHEAIGADPRRSLSVALMSSQTVRDLLIEVGDRGSDCPLVCGVDRPGDVWASQGEQCRDTLRCRDADVIADVPVVVPFSRPGECGGVGVAAVGGPEDLYWVQPGRVRDPAGDPRVERCHPRTSADSGFECGEGCCGAVVAENERGAGASLPRPLVHRIDERLAGQASRWVGAPYRSGDHVARVRMPAAEQLAEGVLALGVELAFQAERGRTTADPLAGILGTVEVVVHLAA